MSTDSDQETLPPLVLKGGLNVFSCFWLSHAIVSVRPTPAFVDSDTEGLPPLKMQGNSFVLASS